MALLAILLLAVLPVWMQQQLDESNFAAFLAQNPAVLVHFVVPWCSFCDSSARVLQQAEKKLAGSVCRFAQVDAERSSGLAMAHGVQQYPTIKLFVDGRNFDFEWELTSANIVDFVQRKLSPHPTMLYSAYDASRIARSDGPLKVSLCVSPLL